MGTAAPHRGAAIETVEIGRCALACVNATDDGDAGLAIVGRFGAAFAGRLDNAADLAAELARHGISTGGLDAAGLVAAAFELYGSRLPARLRGVFACVVTDGSTLHAFRDQLGYGLLFYRSDPGGFYVATEAKQVVAGAGIPKEPDLEVVERIVFNDLDDEMPCALRGVLRLAKGTILTTTGDSVQLERYWRPESLLETADLAGIEIQERFDELLGQAVSRCLTGQDLISLSGGIDSPAVAAFAAPRHLELSGQPLQALTAVYPRFRSVDERPYVELLADRFAIPLQTYEPQANPLGDLAEWVALTDGPYPAASLALYAESYRASAGARIPHGPLGRACRVRLRAELVPDRASRSRTGESAPCGGSSTSAGRRASRFRRSHGSSPAVSLPGGCSPRGNGEARPAYRPGWTRAR